MSQREFNRWLEKIFSANRIEFDTKDLVVKKIKSWPSFTLLEFVNPHTHPRKGSRKGSRKRKGVGRNIWVFNNRFISEFSTINERAFRSKLTRLPLRCTIFKQRFNGCLILYRCDDTY